MKYSKMLLSFLAVSAVTAGYSATSCNLGEMCYLTQGEVSYFKYQQAGDYICALSVPSSALSATADLHMGSAAEFKPVVVTSGKPVQLHAGINANKGNTGELKFELSKGQNFSANEVGVQCALVTSSE